MNKKHSVFFIYSMAGLILMIMLWQSYQPQQETVNSTLSTIEPTAQTQDQVQDEALQSEPFDRTQPPVDWQASDDPIPYQLPPAKLASQTNNKPLATLIRSFEHLDPAHNYLLAVGGYATTYLYDRGLRSLYSALELNNLTLSTLKTLSGEPVFMKGPHLGAQLNLNEHYSFGHYNPAFLDWLSSQLEALKAHPELVQDLKPLYDQHLASIVRTFYFSGQKVAYKVERERIIKVYQNYILDRLGSNGYVMDNPYYQIWPKGTKGNLRSTSPGDFIQEVFRQDAGFMEREGHDWYETVVAHGFWIRRYMDQTHPLFIELLQQLLTLFDPDVLREWHGEPGQNYDLEDWD